MLINSEKLIIDTHAAPSGGASQTFLVKPWRGDLPSVVVVSETIRTPLNVITIRPTDAGELAWVTDSDWYPSADALENDGTTLPSFLTARTIIKSWIAVPITEDAPALHETTAIPTARNTASRSSLVFIIMSSVFGFFVIFIAVTLCSIRFARKYCRRERQNMIEDTALEEVIRSGAITLRGQEVGLERLQEASKRKWEGEEFVMRVLEEPGSDKHTLRERAREERELLESMFEHKYENVGRNNSGCV